jgi:hypothetical protein
VYSKEQEDKVSE